MTLQVALTAHVQLHLVRRWQCSLSFQNLPWLRHHCSHSQTCSTLIWQWHPKVLTACSKLWQHWHHCTYQDFQRTTGTQMPPRLKKFAMVSFLMSAQDICSKERAPCHFYNSCPITQDRAKGSPRNLEHHGGLNFFHHSTQFDCHLNGKRQTLLLSNRHHNNTAFF